MRFLKDIKVYVQMVLVFGLLFASAALCYAADDYAPITNIDKEEVWPLVYNAMAKNNIVLKSFNYGNNEMTSDFSYFSDLLVPMRGRFLFKYENNTLDISMFGYELKEAKTGIWSSSTPTFSNKLKKIRMYMVTNIQETKANPDFVNRAKEAFYNDLWVTAKYFETATELAGQKWFETYLKGKNVSWNLTFLNAASNNDPNYKYNEYYALTSDSLMNDGVMIGNKFNVLKLVTTDANAFTQKGAKKNVTGYVRALSYMNGIFYIIITENPDGEIKSYIAGENKPADKPSITSKADELLKLKELLDKGILTKDEYEAEKKKILDSK